MKLALFAPLAFFTSMVAAVSVTYDTIYDNASKSLAVVACSDGSNGLLTRGFTTFGSLPSFPNIGGAPAVTGWNSPACGSCWKLTFKNAQGASRSIFVTAIDVATPDFNIGLAAMNQLTFGQAQQIGRAPITAAQVAASNCGL
ncbi:elicting plant response protein [Pholiota conissans]|uniref:Elicting plant response protein n=1 Tax=Pholiota conissans TaxID=109636 RepID=A0A9P5ZBC9_9AGAR|nr:elicting plant response protein [Pholiota conissans]